MKKSNWKNCYSEQWAGILIQPAFAHPAKISLALVRRIFNHALERDWIKKGDTCLDPFAGIGGVAFGAMAAGLKFVGQELEPHFVELANGMECTPEKLCPTCKERSEQAASKNGNLFDEVTGNHHFEGNLEFWQRKFSLTGAVILQGDSRRLLENLREQVECVVSSPPFESSGTDRNESNGVRVALNRQVVRKNRDASIRPGEQAHSLSYGSDPANIGNDTGETFWTAAREIVEQCFLALKPGGHAIWVTKRFVRNGKIVEFSQQWAQLCESVGFKVVCWHHAMLTQSGAIQMAIDGKETQRIKERKSFFRRLAEQKGSPRIDWEDVICMVKPKNAL